MDYPIPSSSYGRTTPHTPEKVKPLIHAAPQLQVWKERLERFLQETPEFQNLIGFASSGSSGSPPKCFFFTEKALNHSAKACIQHLRATTGDWVCPLPLWHLGGAMIPRRAALMQSQAYIYPHRWDPTLFAQFIEQHQAAWSSLVPTQIVDIVNAAIPAPDCLQAIVVGGATLDLSTGIQARTLGWPIVQSFGMTEAASQIATGNPNEPFRIDRLPILPHWELKTDEQGTLSIRGEARFSSWIETDTQGDFHIHHIPAQDWWKTQDLVQLDHNMLNPIHRSDRNIKILGELIDLDSIEHALQLHAQDICIMSIPHPRRGAELVACGIHPTKEAAIKQWNQQSSSLYHITQSYPIPIPRNPMGKVLRKELAEAVLQHSKIQTNH